MLSPSYLVSNLAIRLFEAIVPGGQMLLGLSALGAPSDIEHPSAKPLAPTTKEERPESFGGSIMPSKSNAPEGIRPRPLVPKLYELSVTDPSCELRCF